MAESILRVGLTGGIGSGKTVASDYLGSLGVPIIDTDVIARELVKPGQPALREITNLFGHELIGKHDRLDRAKLRDLVFSDADNRSALEDILHPRIRDRAEALIEALDYPYCIIVIPLLLETRYPIATDRILVIDATTSEQCKRVMRRDQLDESVVKSILATQTDRQNRQAKADDIILNDGDLLSFQSRLDQLHQGYYLGTSKNIR